MTDFSKEIIGTDDADQRLDRWLRRKYGKLPQSLIEKMCRKGSVKVDNKKVKPSFRLESNQTILLPVTLGKNITKFKKTGVLSATDHKIIGQLNSNIIYEDEYLMAINKPPGLATQGGTNQNRHIDKYLAQLSLNTESNHLRLIHRLDKYTSGVLLVAKSLAATREMMKLFKNKNINKSYWAVSHGVPKKQTGGIKSSLVKDTSQPSRKMASMSLPNLSSEKKAKIAITKYAVQHTFGTLLSFLVLSPQTGRTHQLRVHLSSMGHPILGDLKYSSKALTANLPADIQATNLASSMFLHARSIEFQHPFFQKEITITAEAPQHFEVLSKYLEWDLKCFG